jgi:hypothetical protein
MRKDDPYQKERKAWSEMRQRCNNPNNDKFHHYGGRGIKVCAQWNESFHAFFSHVGFKPSPKHSLDRIDPDGDYEPGNVRWATQLEQARNKRKTHVLTVDGETKPLSEWAELTGIDYPTLWHRILVQKMDPKDATSIPANGGGWALKRTKMQRRG